MSTQSRIEYGVRGSRVRYGEWQTVIETLPGRETDKEANELDVEGTRNWQRGAGREPDAVLVFRTVTISGWQTEQEDAALTLDKTTLSERSTEHEQTGNET